MKALITFGCSWTYGTGCFYHVPLTREEYRKQKKKSQETDEIANKFSFRGLLAQKHGYHNINFASQGNSNQTQLRKAQEFFNTDEYKRYDKVIVLWGITSTARGEAWIKGRPWNNKNSEEEREGQFKSFMYSHNFGLAKQIIKFHYDHSAEVGRLKTHIHHRNKFLSLLGIQNYWFDTFNHHKYDIPFMIFRKDKHRDLMSKLCMLTGESYENDNYHFSQYKNDCNRSNYLIKNSIINPYSLHPTMKGHKMIADMLDKEISWT
tara:strand:+ start:10038 stop:10826 length:789 start_codon:yes stop_codon:yes gene_type:complete